MRANLLGVMACLALLACDDAEPTREQPESGDGPEDSGVTFGGMRVLAPDESYAGKTLEEWAVEYTRWSFSQTTCDSPQYDRDGSLCSLYQEASDSPVFFLERADYGSGTRPPVTTRTECTVPAGKAILVPVALVAVDNTDVETPRSDADLEQLAVDVKDSMRSMKLKADGVSLSDMRDRGVGPTRSSYAVPPEPNYFSCDEIEGFSDSTVEPALVTGFLAIFEPPEPGPHELEYSSLFTYRHSEYAFHVKHTFVVEAPSE